MDYIYASKAPFATSLQPLEYDLRFSAAKDNSTTRAAVAARSLYAAIPLRSADTELQSTIEYARRQHKLQLQNRMDLGAKARKKNDLI